MIEIVGENIPEELKNSAQKILSYSGISQAYAVVLMTSLKTFKKMADKSFYDPESRKLRDTINTLFYQVYEAVWRRVNEENNCEPLYQMFLRYGYMDEELLTPDQVITLYELVQTPDQSGRFSVYYLKDWLTQIYRQEKEPSVNEFGLDYFAIFRELKKRGEVDEKDRAKYESDIEGRLQHEINNLFRLGQRLCYGQMTGYFPILHSGMINRDLKQSFVSLQVLEEELNRLLAIDFSAFHREIAYNNLEKGIKGELIMKQVLPDIVLVPTYGARAVMWQEITGRVRSSPGRLVFPVFCGEDLEKLVIDVVAKFRWELARSSFSVSRNDPQDNTLTSDYYDYIQFYRKNRDLTEEAREKVKLQVEKYRNNVEEIFISDYRSWLMYESKAMLRLNKVAREILFKHCPFSRPIREVLERQPLYNQLITRFETLRERNLRRLEARYNKLTKPGAEMDPDLRSNLEYYRS